jgi:C_GCAxxG_C_C family probable redox protein
MNPAAAVALNGGVGWSGGMCGALTGAALAVGMLAERRIVDHATAKRVAREIVAATIEAFRAEHGAVDCRVLIGCDLRAPGGHDAFFASGAWRDGCLRQIETVVGRLAGLAEPVAWDAAVRRVEAASGG